MKNILALLYITLFMISCSSGFNPRYYYEKGKRGGLSSSPVIKPVEAPTEVEADKDPFKVGEHNNPDYQFEARKFDSWLFKASFQKDKLPIYNFLTNDSRQWIPGGKDWNNISPAYYYNPKDKENEASGYGITGSTIYKYEGYNPLYDNSGYLPGRMDRFRFYSLYGKAVIVDLQQYLIAVDTYSKLVFAFGKITETKSTFGELVPMKFEAIEYHGDKDFYEYDPIGYVNSDGEVVLYEHYRTEFVKNPTSYLPKQHSFNTVATYTPNGQGYSPYKSIKSTENKDRIIIKAKSLKNISTKSREKIFGKAGSPKNYAAFTYTIGGGVGYNNVPIEKIEDKDPASSSTLGAITWSAISQINTGSSVDFSSSFEKEVEDIKDGIKIELASRVDKYNKETGFADTAKFGSDGSGQMAYLDSPKLVLKYDSTKEIFTVDNSDTIQNNATTLTTITYDNNFTLKRGDVKDITIKYNWKKGNDTSNGEEFEITYTLSFEKLN